MSDHPTLATETETEASMSFPLSEADPQPVELGRRIKMLRVARGLTLKELEERGGISATHVSEIERGKASPTVGALARIARALGVRPATLVEPRTLPLVTLKRAEQRERRAMLLDRADLRPVSDPTYGVPIGAVLMRLPIAREPALEHRHEGEEFLTVLSGQVEIRIESEVHALRAGDSLHFRAERMHAYVNPASEPAVLLLASRPRMAF
jgi:transcriptional regulator with XRE-family HTH domain